MAEKKFELGERVEWVSQAAGHSRTKVGEVAECVPAGRMPDRTKFERLYKSSGVGLPRDHESYVILVGNKPYWPRVKNLQAPSAT